MMMKVVQHCDERTAAVASAWLAEHTQQFHSTRRTNHERLPLSIIHNLSSYNKESSRDFYLKKKSQEKLCSSRSRKEQCRKQAAISANIDRGRRWQREKRIFFYCVFERKYLDISKHRASSNFTALSSARMYSSSLFQPMKIKNIFSAAVASASEAFCRRDFPFI